MTDDMADRAEDLLGLHGDQAFQDWRAANPAHYHAWRTLAHRALTEGRVSFSINEKGEPVTTELSLSQAAETVLRPWEFERLPLLASGTPLGELYSDLMERAGTHLDPDRDPDDWREGQRLMAEADQVASIIGWRNVAGKELERAGELELAKALYEENVEDQVHGTHPYERLRILYTRERRYDDAIRVR